MTQRDLLIWMDKKPTLTVLRKRRMQEREIYDRARRGEVELTREELLDIHYGSASAGQFFTPDVAAHLVAGLANIQEGETVLDPSAGLGNLMLPALSYTKKVRGIELMRDTQELAVNNLGLDIERANAFEVDWGEADVVLQNPPFGVLKDKPEWYPFKGTARKEVAFLYLALKTAKRRVVSILPNSLLNTKRDFPIRKYILDRYKLCASIDLPPKTFWKSAREVNKWKWPVTTAHTGILVIDKERPEGDYKIFMAIPEHGDDLPQILEKWRKFEGE